MMVARRQLGRGFRRVVLACAALCCAWAVAAVGEAGATVVSFSSTGAEQTFTVPAGVTSVHVVAIGGKGGAGAPGGNGGFGATATADLPVTPGQVLYVEVAGNGTPPSNGLGSTGGFNGGGAGVDYYGGSGGGGGASDVRSSPRGSPLAPDPRLIVAGGGGGGGGGNQGAPGGAAGADGGTVTGGAGGGGRGMASGGGTPGTPNGTAGTVGNGGNGGSSGTSTGGGGGGGGAYGGGGGGSGPPNPGGGGGGGSSAFGAGATNTSWSADTTGTPSVTFTYMPAPAGGGNPPPAGGGTPPPSGGGGPAPGGGAGGGGAPLSDFRLLAAIVGQDGAISIPVNTPGAGTLTGKATTRLPAGKLRAGAAKKKRKKAQAVTYGSAAMVASRTGLVTLTIAPSAAAKKALKKGKTLKVSISVTFTPNGGMANTKTTSVTVKGKRQKGK